ncbi:MAG: hypothetical protein PVI87_07710 [Gammaproteobacteria bacterium]
MKINTLTGRVAAVAAGALVAFAAFSGPPEGVPLKISYWGAGIETAVDSNQDGLLLSLSMTEAKGSFGASSAYITSEFAVDPTVQCPDDGDDYLPLVLFQSTGVLSFANGDQLYAVGTGGEMCLNLDTGYYSGDAEGFYMGGTGRFAGATGSYTSTYSGQNLEPFLSGFRSITGTIEGRVILP